NGFLGPGPRNGLPPRRVFLRIHPLIQAPPLPYRPRDRYTKSFYGRTSSDSVRRDQPMAEDLTFLMGKFPALLPGDRRYARNHMWCREIEGRQRFGFTAYAVRLMQDVYFLDWQINPGDAVPHMGQIGHIETSKAVADLFAPMAGTLVEFNQELLKDPTPINLDYHCAGRAFGIAGDASASLTAAEYYAFLDANWEKTQRMLKGHM